MWTIEAPASRALRTSFAYSSGVYGMPGLKLGTKIFAGLFGDDMVFKLGAGSKVHAGALKLQGAKLWDPSGRDRPFKDWVQVPVVHAKRWGELAEEALAGLNG